MVISSGDLMRTAEAAFWRVSSGKLFLNSWSILRKITTMESDLNKVVHATLLKSLSIMANFLEVFQDFNKNSFQYKKHLLWVFLNLTNDVGRCDFSKFAKEKVSVARCIKVK